jgi:hypothetical protein
VDLPCRSPPVAGPPSGARSTGLLTVSEGPKHLHTSIPTHPRAVAWPGRPNSGTRPTAGTAALTWGRGAAEGTVLQPGRDVAQESRPSGSSSRRGAGLQESPDLLKVVPWRIGSALPGQCILSATSDLAWVRRTGHGDGPAGRVHFRERSPQATTRRAATPPTRQRGQRGEVVTSPLVSAP